MFPTELVFIDIETTALAGPDADTDAIIEVAAARVNLKTSESVTVSEASGRTRRPELHETEVAGRKRDALPRATSNVTAAKPLARGARIHVGSQSQGQDDSRSRALRARVASSAHHEVKMSRVKTKNYRPVSAAQSAFPERRDRSQQRYLSHSVSTLFGHFERSRNVR